MTKYCHSHDDKHSVLSMEIVKFPNRRRNAAHKNTKVLVEFLAVRSKNRISKTKKKSLDKKII